MTNIYQRIGEALASNGLHDIIFANDLDEETILSNAGFKIIGSMKLDDGKIVSLFKFEQKIKEVIKIVEVPNKNNDWPWNDHKSIPPYQRYYSPGTVYCNDASYKNTLSSDNFVWSDLQNNFNMSAELYKVASTKLDKK